MRESVGLEEAVVVTRCDALPNAERSAGIVLVEEVGKRTGLQLPLTTSWPENKTVIAISSKKDVDGWKCPVPVRTGENLPETRKEGYRLFVEIQPSSPPVVWILGADPAGTLYGVGALLRNLNWAEGHATLPKDLEIATAPRYPIRGHELGYRARANSYDALTVEQFDQYIRELVLFGANSIEGIPFEDERQSPHMKISRREMNRKLGDICERYGLDYWVWSPADFDLRDRDARDKMLQRHEEFFEECGCLKAVFFPGGDPGDNPPELVWPYLEKIAERLLPIHPEARIWLSLLGFDEEQVTGIHEYIDTKSPSWFGGLVADTSGPAIADTRERLSERYPLRMYPDITHNKLSQYEVPWWDPAYALTLGREAINPRPVQYGEIINWYAPHTDGFISYSDGVHDDVNKVIWNARGWDPDVDVRDVLVEYARLFFGPHVEEDAADGILALEKNWQGPLLTHGAVEGTLMMWQRLEEKAPNLVTNWRWQMNLVRAYYDAYTRRRLILETKLEEKANEILATAPERGADRAMKDALEVLKRAETDPCHSDLCGRIEGLCDDLFRSIGLQTSVERYQASDGERGAFLDYIHFPLNNRWWLEDQFAQIALLDSEEEKQARIHTLCTWENPGTGSFYDDIGHVGKSPRVQRRVATNTDPVMRTIPNPTFWWWGDGMEPRARLSWQWTMDWPEAVVYEGLDPKAHYRVRMSGYGKFLLRINGKRVSRRKVHGIQIGEIQEVPVPDGWIQHRRLVLTWDVPKDEGHLNWRQRSRIAEVWLIKT